MGLSKPTQTALPFLMSICLVEVILVFANYALDIAVFCRCRSLALVMFS